MQYSIYENFADYAVQSFLFGGETFEENKNCRANLREHSLCSMSPSIVENSYGIRCDFMDGSSVYQVKENGLYRFEEWRWEEGSNYNCGYFKTEFVKRFIGYSVNPWIE